LGAKAKVFVTLALAGTCAVAGITATGSMATPPKAATGSQLFHGPIKKVNSSKHTFKMNDLLARGGKGRIRHIVTDDGTRYVHLSGYSALHKGLNVDVTAHEQNVTGWIADKVKKVPAGPIPSGVTIHFRQPKKFVGSKKFVGFVFSKDPRICASGRPVKLFRQTGKKQRLGRDVKIQQRAFASKQPNGKYKWHVHLQPAHPAKYYARIGKFADCEKDASKTIHAP
jgi:hypothetical protein